MQAPHPDPPVGQHDLQAEGEVATLPGSEPQRVRVRAVGDLYSRTVDMTRTRYGGSEALPRQPTPEDPRNVTAQSRLQEDPRLRQFWAGYAFAEDFREERGHAFMFIDQIFTERQRVAKQLLSVYPPYRNYVERAPFLGAGAVIVHTEAGKERLVRRGVRPERVHVLPAGMPARTA